jgi:primary-amine oxidase
VAVLLAARAGLAQENTGISDKLVEKVLTRLDLPFTKAGVSYRFRLQGTEVELAPVQQGKKLLLRARLAGPVPSAQAIERYNRDAVTAHVVSAGTQSAVLQAGVDCRLGVTTSSLTQFITGFGQDLRDYQNSVGKSAAPRLPDGVADAGGPDVPPGDNRPVETRPTAPPAQGAPVPLAVTPGTDDKEIEIAFPTRDGASRDTAWKIIWDMKDGKEAAKEGFKVSGRDGSPVLFQIKKAYYRPGAKAEWLQVLENAHPSEFYVPYFFQHTRFFDLRDVGSYVPLRAVEGGARSRLLGKEKRVMAELRDRGLAYKHGDIARRGEELVLWANFAAGNYTYLVEFCFHDDGTVAFKHAPTGYNFFDHFDSAAHMHNCLWRIGVKLALLNERKANNLVSLVRLPYDANQLGPGGKLVVQPITRESFHDFEAKEFTRLRVTNPNYSIFPVAPAATRANRGEEKRDEEKRERLPISYDLVPLTQGIARHFRYKDEAFSHHDFWVTRSDSPVKMYTNLPAYFEGKENGKALADSDGVVLWHMSSALHVPRSEDGIWLGSGLDNGQALVSFTTVELRPRNLFIKTPLYKR